MKNLLDFLIKIGKLRKLKRRGVSFYGEKNPENSPEHTFRTTIAAWILARKKNLNIGKVLKMALIHDICELYVGDVVPFEGTLIKDKKKLERFLKRWPYFSTKEKEARYLEKFKKEKKSLERLTKNLPQDLKKEIMDLWLEFERGNSREARFVCQIDRIENVLEAFECWKRNKKFPFHLWWRYAEQVMTDPVLLKFLEAIEKEVKKKN